MTGVGAYFYIVWGIWLRHCLNYKQDDYKLIWPRITTLPVVVKRPRSVTNGPVNGAAGKTAKKDL